MFIKFGTKEHLEALRTNGAMWFNPCIKFREWEKNEGIKDTQDGGIKLTAQKTHIFDNQGNISYLGTGKLGIILAPAKHTPVFCLYETEKRTDIINVIEDIRAEFPDYDYALIIDDENDFLENVRYSFKNKAFCHKIYYQNDLSIEFNEFLFDGQSDIFFYEPKKKNRYYAYTEYKPFNGKIRRLFIDDSNFYKTMFSKNLNYIKQSEYRIVLPYMQIKEGQYFYIDPFEADLIHISNLGK